jgi:hypothetical protein
MIHRHTAPQATARPASNANALVEVAGPVAGRNVGTVEPTVVVVLEGVRGVVTSVVDGVTVVVVTTVDAVTGTVVVVGVVVVDGVTQAGTVSDQNWSVLYTESTVTDHVWLTVWSGELMVKATGAPKVSLVMVRTVLPSRVAVTTVPSSVRGMLNVRPSQLASTVFALAEAVPAVSPRVSATVAGMRRVRGVIGGCP